MKIMVTTIPTDLATGWLLSSFLLSYKQEQESGFQQDGGLVTRNNFCILFIASPALLQSHAKYNRLL